MDTLKEHPDRTALIYYGRKFTYRDVDQESDQLASVFLTVGVMRGDRIGFVAPNTPLVPMAFLAAWKIGAIVAPVNPLESSEKVVEQLKLADPKLIIILDKFSEHRTAIYKDPDLGSVLRCRMEFSAADHLSLIAKAVYSWKTRKEKIWPTWFTYRRGMNYYGRVYKKFESPSSDDLAVLQFTGGTSGTTKAAMLTHGNLVVNAWQSIHHVNSSGEEKIISCDTVFLGVMPFFHVYGLSVCLTMAFAVGASVVLLPKFDAKEVVKTIAKYKVTAFPGIQRMFAAIVDHLDGYDKYRKQLHSLSFSCSGAGRLSQSVRKNFASLSNAPIFEGYGLSEASPVVSIFLDQGESGKMGKPIPGTEVKLAEDGELLVRGPQVMAGYWRNIEETDKAVKDGWLHSGDLAKQHEDGSFEFVDRKKDMIKINGENVYPSEIEKVLLGHDLVREVAVLGLPDERSGEKCVACVILEAPVFEGHEQDLAKSLINFCRNEGLSGVQIPKEIRFVSEIPKNIVGKVLKRELKKQFMGPA